VARSFTPRFRRLCLCGDESQGAPSHLVPVDFTRRPGIEEFGIIGMRDMTFDLAVDAGLAQ
jgi:hypothetical protein